MSLSELHENGQRRRERLEQVKARKTSLREGIAVALGAGTAENDVRERVAVSYKTGLFQRMTVLSQQGARDAITAARGDSEHTWTQAERPAVADALQQLRTLARDVAEARSELRASNIKLVQSMWAERRAGTRPTEIVQASGLSTQTGFDWLAAQERHDRIRKTAEDLTDAVMVIPVGRDVELMLMSSPEPNDDGPSRRDVDRRGLDRALEDWSQRRWSELQDALATEGYALGAQDDERYVLVTDRK